MLDAGDPLGALSPLLMAVLWNEARNGMIAHRIGSSGESVSRLSSHGRLYDGADNLYIFYI